MKIVILCDQFDCTFNEGNRIHPYPSDVCKHPHPDIHRYPTHIGTICDSKDRRVTDPAIIHPSCSTCESTNIDDCINCCHKNPQFIKEVDNIIIDDNNE